MLSLVSHTLLLGTSLDSQALLVGTGNSQTLQLRLMRSQNLGQVMGFVTHSGVSIAPVTFIGFANVAVVTTGLPIVVTSFT